MANLHWRAVYDDGTSLSQYNDDGTENLYADIDRSRLAEFQIIDSDRGRLRHALLLNDPRKRLIWRRRTQTYQDGGSASFHLVGWQITIGDENIQSVTLVSEQEGQEDLSIASTGWREDMVIFCAPELLEFETVSPPVLTEVT